MDRPVARQPRLSVTIVFATSPDHESASDRAMLE
jgi:hypothetical protein